MPELQNVAIMPGENVRFAAEFHPHLILKHLSHAVVVTDRRAVVRSPHTIFGIIPHGYVEQTAPLSAISEFNSGKVLSGSKLSSGALYVLLAFGSLYAAVAMTPIAVLLFIPFSAIAAYKFFTANNIGFVFRNHGAGQIVASAGTSEGQLVEDGKRIITELLYGGGTGSVPQPAAARAVAYGSPYS
ncbi:hypothetical protein FOS14_13290 [Skermania sp. ID1734]|uniref:hypothetical protein n=1 Tax=Skermania sp. ID1734 TaxID=2597516 RepID=UPI00117D716A|nr:hypothetical protein [Skermania sp. ID1734]TSD99316.1 hypothetical protein FOS14_13290 [Skermania sp. ID1734]